MLQNSNAAVSTGDAAGAAANASQGSGNYVTPTSIRATMTIVASLPIIMVYPFLQRYFVKGLTLGGVKG
ncbi:ABC-type glycerol-3-phosphate transport system permease component [Paenibacillus harenae]|uniref:ABC-type glycerol-3-phosphate transport system permease component n=1 Tax=Paenibacillus harenae TaxID=306543 RepID=A0ABT9U0N1_PAEHA|nr:ABC-type glycerol-3-phosphate transport system permease component [Paenibacillus harenae]